MLHATIEHVRKVFQFPVLERLWPYAVAVTIYAALVVLFGRGLVLVDGATDRLAEAAITGVLFAWMIGFRSTAAYNRWWEARTLWGQLVNDCRNLVLKATTYITDPGEQAKLRSIVARFPEALRDHLRIPFTAPPGPHQPMQIAEELFRLVRGWKESGQIDGYTFLAFDMHVQSWMNVCGGCERIRSTPFTASYRGLLRKGIFGYLLFLPWVMNDVHGWVTVPVMLLVAYPVLGLELIASNMDDPFGYDGDDLPLDRLVETIRRATGASTAA